MHGWPPPQHLFGHQVGQILTIWAKGGMDFCSTILRIRLHPMHPMFFSHFIHLKKPAGASISTCICDPFVYWPWGDSYFRFPCGPMLDLRLDLSCRIAAGGLADGLEFGKVSNVKRSAWNARKTPSYNYAVYFTGVCTDLSGNDGGDMEGQVGWLYKSCHHFWRYPSSWGLGVTTGVSTNSVPVIVDLQGSAQFSRLRWRCPHHHNVASLMIRHWLVFFPLDDIGWCELFVCLFSSWIHFNIDVPPFPWGWSSYKTSCCRNLSSETVRFPSPMIDDPFFARHEAIFPVLDSLFLEEPQWCPVDSA